MLSNEIYCFTFWSFWSIENSWRIFFQPGGSIDEMLNLLQLEDISGHLKSFNKPGKTPALLPCPRFSQPSPRSVEDKDRFSGGRGFGLGQGGREGKVRKLRGKSGTKEVVHTRTHTHSHALLCTKDVSVLTLLLLLQNVSRSIFPLIFSISPTHTHSHTRTHTHTHTYPRCVCWERRKKGEGKLLKLAPKAWQGFGRTIESESETFCLECQTEQN